MDVRGDDRPDSREHARLDEHLRAERMRLLARLEERPERSRSLVAEPDHGARERHEGRHVHVVPASVHQPVLGGEGDAGLLDDRQAVELGTCDDRGRSVSDADQQPGADHALGGSAERVGDTSGRLGLEMPELGARVQQAPQPRGGG